MKYSLHKIGNDYQVYGKVNGFVFYEVESPFYKIYRYVINVHFFIGSCRIAVKDRGYTSQIDVVDNQKIIESRIKERIDKIIENEKRRKLK